MTDAAATLDTLGTVLAAHVRHQPDAPLLIAPEAQRTLTYGGLSQATERLARCLQARGLQPGARVGFSDWGTRT